MSSLNENDLNQVSGGMVGPDPNWYAINARGLKYGSPEYINYCNKNGLDPNLSLDQINANQEARNRTNASLRKF